MRRHPRASASARLPARPSSCGRGRPRTTATAACSGSSARPASTSKADVVNELPMESYLRGVVPVGGSGGLARGDSQGPGDRRALVFGRPAPPGQGHVRRLRRHALAGLPRQERREGRDRRGHRGDGAGGPPDAGRRHRERVLPLDRRRRDGEQRVRVGVLDRRDPQQPVQLPPRLARPAAGRHALRRCTARTRSGRPRRTRSPRSGAGSRTTRERTSARSSSSTCSNRGVSGRLISVTLIGADGTKKTVSGDVFVSIFNAHRPAGDPLLRSTLFDLAPIS